VIETPNERRRYRGAGLLLILGGRSIWQFLTRADLSKLRAKYQNWPDIWSQFMPGPVKKAAIAGNL